MMLKIYYEKRLVSLHLLRSLSFPLKDSLYPFSQGLPGSINKGPTLRLSNYFRIAFDVNSRPLSERICSGRPCKMNKLVNSSIRSIEVNLLLGSVARLSRLNSSMTVRILKERLSCVRS